MLMSNVTDFDVLGSVPVHLQAVEPAPQLWLRPLCSKTMKKVAHKRYVISGQNYTLSREFCEHDAAAS